MVATIVAYFRKPLRMMPCSSRVEKNLPSNLHASNKLKHGSWGAASQCAARYGQKSPASNPGAKS
jgi:hypothetical protein